jgi:hypothetical protein
MIFDLQFDEPMPDALEDDPATIRRSSKSERGRKQWKHTH